MLLVSTENEDIKIHLIFYEGNVCVYDHIIHILDGFNDILPLFGSVNRGAAGLEFLNIFRILDSHDKPIPQSFCLPEKLNVPDVN